MIIIIVTLVLSMLLFTGIRSQLFSGCSRWGVLFGMLPSTKTNTGVFFVVLVVFVLFLNLIGNIPGMKSITLFYWFSGSISITVWLSIILCVYYTQVRSFVAHLMPYGAPIGLGVILPMIEGFSQIIRPITLIIRLSTNLAAGHIMLYMFSFFALSSIVLGGVISVVLVILIILEVCVSALQAYIFGSLIAIYIAETE